MEFFLYLNQNTLELIRTIQNLKYSITENDSICVNSYVTGAVKYPQKIFSICTDNIKTNANDAIYVINRVVTHESLHVAHMCNGSKPLGISKINISNKKLENIQRSLSLGKNINYDIEYEAYMMEDNPQKVNQYIKTFCF